MSPRRLGPDGVVRRGGVAVLVALAGAGSACNAAESGDTDAATTISRNAQQVGADTSIQADPDPSPSWPDSGESRRASDPFVVYDWKPVSDATTTILREIPLLVANLGPERVIVRAEAGLSAVVVDTVAPGDSIRVSIQVRADSVRLTATSVTGDARGTRMIRAGLGEQRAAFP